MKIIKYVVLFQLMAFIGFAQDNPLSSHVKSQFLNNEGVIQFIEFDENSTLNVANRSDFLKEFLKASDQSTFIKIDSQKDKIGFTNETYQQYFNDIPVEFGIYKTHLKNGVLSAINGDYYPIIEINTKPSISASNAVSLAYKNAKLESNSVLSIDENKPKVSNPTLVIFPKMENINPRNRLAYKLDIDAEMQFYHSDVYVDAHTGEIIFENNKMHEIDNPANGTTLYNGVQNFKAQQIGPNHRLRQSSNGNGIETYNATSGVQNATDVISPSTSFDNINNTAVQVHWGAERTYEYFMQYHARNSFDNNGALIKSYITPGSAVPNAHWTGSVMHYSIGNGSTVNALASLDVVGHEFSHAVGDYTANLIYSYESGAIDESFADIFGEMVENFGQGTNDWLCGAACVSNGFRSMSDPKSKGQPDTYQGQYWSTSSSDNFGVHTNSGVQNKWFYLLAVGGTGINDNGYAYNVNGIGIQKAAEIAYRTLSVFLTPTSKYHYVAEVSGFAAGQLFGAGSPEQLACAEAWRAVGVISQPTEWSPPTKPLNLVSTSATPYLVSLSWDASTDNVGVLGYTILKDGKKVGTTTDTYKTVSGFYLNPNTVYEFTVVAFDAAGNYSQASNKVFILFDTIDPTTPSNLTSSNTTETTTDLTWTPSTDNFLVEEYHIYQNNIFLATVSNNSPTYNSYQATGLTPNTTYQYKVKAIDSSGNESNFSNIVNVTTLAPCANGNVTLSITFDSYPEEVSWDIKDNNNFVVASGANYDLQAPFSTVTFNYTLSNGFYTLNMYDSYGDGIWSPEGYVLSSNVVIASGNNTNPMATVVTTAFCIGGPLNNNSNFNAIKPTNINDKLTNSEFSGFIYPNPLQDRLYFKNFENENNQFLIIDITGKIVMNGIFESDNSVDVSNLQSGMYILEIQGNEETKNHKFIKK